MSASIRAAVLVALAGLLVIAPAATADHAGPLAGQWHLDSDFPGEGNNEVTPDSSGHGLDAATSNGTLIDIAAGGRFGNYLSETHRGTLRPPATSPLLQPQRLTVLAWVRRSGNPGTLSYIAGQGDDGGTCAGPSYALYSGTTATDGLRFFIRRAGGTFVSSPSAGNGVWDGRWHMVAGVYDGSRVRLYVDGAEVGAGAPAEGATIDYGLSGNRFFFDGYPPVCPGSGDFSGAIDELRVYRRGLSATEIARLAAAPGPEPPVLVPDGQAPPPPDGQAPPPIVVDTDGDGVPDGADNCRTTPNTDQRDVNGNGIGLACEPPVARLAVSPNPTCVGTRTRFDGRGSTADDPIVRYVFSYRETSGEHLYRNDRRVIAGDGPSPSVMHVFDWNSPAAWNKHHRDFGGPPIFPAGRENTILELFITTASGARAYAEVPVSFAQSTSDQPRTGCPSSALVPVNAASPLRLRGTRAPGVFGVRTACRSSLSCLGVLALRNKTLVRTSRRKRKTTTLGTKAFVIPPGATRTVTVKLNKKARRLLKRKRRLKTRVSLYTVSPTGKTLVRSKTVTLTAKRKRKVKLSGLRWSLQSYGNRKQP